MPDPLADEWVNVVILFDVVEHGVILHKNGLFVKVLFITNNGEPFNISIIN